MAGHTSAIGETVVASEFPFKAIRAFQTQATIRVYQAYADPIADAALAAGRFVAPFKRSRMTWIKPSFLWMMYRCGWGQKDDGQRRVLAIDLHVDGFREALERATLATEQRGKTDVIVQWDPERDLWAGALEHRSLQMGLRDKAVDAYVDRWIAAITDVTPLVRQIHGELRAHREAEARALLPIETPFETSTGVAAVLGMNGDRAIG